MSACSHHGLSISCVPLVLSAADDKGLGAVLLFEVMEYSFHCHELLLCQNLAFYLGFCDKSLLKDVTFCTATKVENFPCK